MARSSARTSSRAITTTTACVSRTTRRARTRSPLAATADTLLGDLEHRKYEVEDLATGKRLRPGLEALGWKGSRLVWLVHHGPAPDPGHPTQEVDAETVLPLKLEWVVDWPPEVHAAHLPVEAEVDRRLGSRIEAAIEDGRAIGFTQWVAIGDGAEVQSAFVTDSARGRGLGGALVAAAARRAFAAGARYVIIGADDEDRPKQLYQRLGFSPAWTMHELVRRPPGHRR